jgi:hypothetical protein
MFQCLMAFYLVRNLSPRYTAGLRNVFNFLVSTGKLDNVTGGIDAADRPRAVAEAALAGTDATAVEALEIMLLAWAAECRAFLSIPTIICVRTYK